MAGLPNGPVKQNRDPHPSSTPLQRCERIGTVHLCPAARGTGGHRVEFSLGSTAT